MSAQSLKACISQGYENLGSLFDTVDAFLAVDQREEAYAAEIEFTDNLGTPPSLIIDPWANPIYPRWLMEAVKIWERYKDLMSLNYAHQTKSSSESLSEKSSSIDKEQNSQGSGGLQGDAKNVVRVQGVDDATITSNAEETTTPGRNVSNEAREVGIACIHDYDLTEENEAGPSLYEYNSSEESSSDNNIDGPSDKEDGVGPCEEDQAEASEQQHIPNEEDETGRLGGDRKDEQASDFSDPKASSCEACMLPDDESMVLCENEAIHKDGEGWYHFTCVGLSVETIPGGIWYCPPCRSKMRGKTEPSRLGHGNDGDVTTVPKKKHSSVFLLKPLEVSENKCMESQPKSRKPGGKTQEVPKESKQPISKKANEDTKKPGKSRISKNRWRDAIEEQKVAELVKEYQNDPTVPEKDKYGEVKWKAIAAMLLDRHGYDRTHDSIKCKFARKIRKSANYDERSEKKKNPNRMQTSVESPENRKRKRQAKAQAKAQASGEPLSMRKKAKRRSREEEEAQEDVIGRVNVDEGLASRNDYQGDVSNVREEDLDGDGFNEDNVVDSRNFERHLPPQFQQFDWSPRKNKGKRKRDENDDEQDSERHVQMPRSS